MTGGLVWRLRPQTDVTVEVLDGRGVDFNVWLHIGQANVALTVREAKALIDGLTAAVGMVEEIQNDVQRGRHGR